MTHTQRTAAAEDALALLLGADTVETELLALVATEDSSEQDTAADGEREQDSEQDSSEREQDSDALAERPIAQYAVWPVVTARPIIVYESQQQAKARAQREREQEYQILKARIAENWLFVDVLAIKRMRKLEKLLNICEREQQRTHSSERAITPQVEASLITAFLENPEDSNIPVEIQCAIARGTYYDMEDQIIARLDSEREQDSSN